jgi:hypothetical protein
VLLAAAFALLAGCATRGESAYVPPDVLTAEQLANYQHLNAFDAIRQTRPQWLRNTRGQSSLRQSSSDRRGLRVYVDGVLLGGAADLRSLEVRAIHEARFLDSRQATTRFGTNHAEGAIVVTTVG